MRTPESNQKNQQKCKHCGRIVGCDYHGRKHKCGCSRRDGEMLYQKAKIENDQIVITDTKVIDQSKLTSDCWLIQFDGLSACENCDCLDTPECGGQNIRKQLLQ